MAKLLFNRKLMVLFWVALVWVAALLPYTQAQETAPEAAPTAVRPSKPLPVQVLQQDGAALALYFTSIPQGGLGLLHVTGDGVQSVRARFLNLLTEFFPTPDDGFYGLISAGMEQSPRVYDLAVFVAFADGRRATLNTQVKVDLGGFIRQDFNVPSDRAYLIDPQVERNEFARLESIFTAFTEDKLWGTDGFEMPVKSELTSPFGAFRILNGTVPTRHTGWDLKAAVGTPVLTMGAGKVAFAGLIDIRGNYIVVDHGYGIYSGYAHLSQVHVTTGQTVVKGQIIGVSGNTGRSSGPHLHWEINLNGQWVDTVQFINLWLP